MATVNGDQNPVLPVAGLSVGLTHMDVSSGVSTGVSSGVGAAAWVTVNVFVATPPVEPVTVTVYVPVDTFGTDKSMFTVLAVRAVIVPMFVVPKVMLNMLGVWTLYITIKTIVPGGPSEGFNATDIFSACTIGVIAAAKVRMLRKSSASVALLELFSISIKNFRNENAPLPDDVAFSQI